MKSPIAPSRAAKSERGAELIEFALVFPLLLFVVLGIVDFGFLFQRMEVVTNAAREGARIAVLPNYPTLDVQCRVVAYVRAGGIRTTPTTGCVTSNPTVSVTPASIPTSGAGTISGRNVTVTFTHNYLFIGGIASWFGGGSFSTVPVTGVAVMRDEIAVPAGGS